MKTKEDPRIAKLRRMASMLQDKHFTWIISAAISGFEKSVRDNENEIARHVVLGEMGRSVHALRGPKDRDEKTKELVRQVGEYNDILNFLDVLRELTIELSAEKWADALIKSGFGRVR